MHALPFALALAIAAMLAAPLLRALSEGGHLRENFRGRELPFPFGVLVPAAALVALVPLTLLSRLASAEVFHPETLPVAAYALGVLALGLIDDTLGGAGAGAEAEVGSSSARARADAERAGGGVRGEQLALRPPTASGEPRPLWAMGLFAAPALVAGSYDVRERAMLGDTGASLLGALAGLWLVLTLSSAGQIIALGLLLALTIYGEIRSLTALIERTP